MLNPKLSIIIPCYNCEKTLMEAVDSCYTQDLSDFEIVMVNDGSTDNTHVILDNIKKKYSNIKIIEHSSNRGGGAARNTAIKNTTNEIIFCLDSDDMLPPHTLSKMLLFLTEKKCDGVAIHKSIKFNGVNIKSIDRIDEFGYINQKIPTESLIEKKGSPLCPLYSVFMHTKKAFEITGGYPEDHGFDTQGFAWRFLLNGLIAYTCPETSYLHRINFHKSYYLREYFSGKVNLNWIKIYSEFLPMLEKDVVKEIIDFDINSNINISNKLKNFKRVFRQQKAVNFKNNSTDIYKEIMSSEKFYMLLFQSARFDNIKKLNVLISNNDYKIPKCIKIIDNKAFFLKPVEINLMNRIIRRFKKI